jgi:hypothetical protein
MTDPGLNQRLRQRSRRAGFMIGISMALTIAVCVGGFSLIYAALDDTVGDFISRDVPDPVIPTAEPTEPEVAQQSDNAPEEQQSTEEAADPTEEPETEATAESTEESEEFVPDFQTSSDSTLNFRTEPSTRGGSSTVIIGLPPETPIQFMDQTEESDDPEVDGEDGWMYFRTEDGTEGWLRAIDVNPFEP